MLNAFTTVLGSWTCKHCWTIADIVIAGPSSVVMTFVPLHARIEICVTELGHNRQLSPEQCTRSCGLDKASVTTCAARSLVELSSCPLPNLDYRLQESRIEGYL